jgi:hypothetical protein
MTKPKASFVVYVDESGDEGFAFKRPRTGSSQRYRVRTILRWEWIKGGQKRRIEIVDAADRSRSGRHWSAPRQRKENL